MKENCHFVVIKILFYVNYTQPDMFSEQQINFIGLAALVYKAL